MRQVSDYLRLLAGEHRNKPKFGATVELLTAPLAAVQQFLANLPSAFDLDTAVGLQLDIDGIWIGRSRQIEVPLANVFFSFDTPNLGFDQGAWFGPFTASEGLMSFDDATYRALLRAKIVANGWDGTIQEAQAALQQILNPYPTTILGIVDNYDMSMDIGLAGTYPPPLIYYLITGNYVPFKPEGVALNTYVVSIQGAPLFGLDVETSFISGLDVGAWGVAPSTVTQLPIVASGNAAVLSGDGIAIGVANANHGINNGMNGAASVTTTSYVVGNVSTALVGSGSTITVATVRASAHSNIQSTGTTSVFLQQVGVLSFNSATATTVSFSFPPLPTGITSPSLDIGYATSAAGPFTALATNAPYVSNYTATGLSASTAYYFEVAIVSGSTIYPYVIGGPFDTTINTVPGAVSNIIQLTTLANSINVSWTAPVSGGTVASYSILSATSTGGPFTSAAVGVVATNHTVAGLNPSTAYYFQVFAVGTTGVAGPTTQAGPFTTAVFTPGPVTAITLVGTPTTTGETVSWTAPDTTHTYTYNVGYGKASSGPFTTAVVSTVSFSVNTLTPGTAYFWQISGVTGSVTGPSTVGGPFSTAAATFTPGPVTNIALVGAPTANSETISWTAPDTGHTYTYSVGHGTSATGPFTTTSGVTTTTNTAATLSPGVGYYWQVAAVTGGVTGPATVAGPFATPSANTTTVSNITQVDITANSLTISFQFAGGAGYSYATYVGPNVAGPFTLADSGTIPIGISFESQINGLSPSSTYYVEMATIDSNNVAGPFVTAGPFTTIALVPPSAVASDEVIVSVSTPNQMTVTPFDSNTGTPPVTYTIYTSTSAGGPWVLKASNVTNETTVNIPLPG